MRGDPWKQVETGRNGLEDASTGKHSWLWKVAQVSIMPHMHVWGALLGQVVFSVRALLPGKLAIVTRLPAGQNEVGSSTYLSVCCRVQLQAAHCAQKAGAHACIALSAWPC